MTPPVVPAADDIPTATDIEAATSALDGLIAAIEAAYPAVGGRVGFLDDPGGWIDYLDLTTDNDLAAAAIACIRVQPTEGS